MHTHRDSGNTEHKADMSTKENWRGISSLKYWVYQQKKSVLEAERAKPQGIFKGKHNRITADFSIETLKARRAKSSILSSKRPCLSS